MEIPTLLRQAEHKALSNISLPGTVIDLGGDAKATYRKLLQGNPVWHTVNLDPKANPDTVHDLEQPLPFESNTYDHAVLMNVLEHVFHYRQLLQEAVRVVRPGGTVVIVVPFLFPVHPSPDDFHRFTESALRKECALAGLNDVRIEPLGGGVFSAQYVHLDRLLPFPIRFLNFYTGRYLVLFGDFLWTRLAQLLKRAYRSSDYALGYVVVGRASSS